jgi:DNA repair exonuclease SbcCD ATPase subunit
MPRRFSLLLLSLLVVAGFAVSVRAYAQDDTLTEDEVQEIRDNKTNPNERIKLYLKFIDQRLDALKQLAGSGKSTNEKGQIHDKFEEFTRLCDELQDNLDTYNEAHADIRKSLKDLVADTARWPTVLNAVGTDPSFDFSQKTALEAAKSAAEEAHQMSLDQQVYFDVHKKARGGTGTGPS